MDIKDYCDSMYAELTGMKARLYDILAGHRPDAQGSPGQNQTPDP